MDSKHTHTQPSMTEMIGTDKPQYIPEQVHRAFVEEFFRSRTAIAVAQVTRIEENRKDGFTHETE